MRSDNLKTFREAWKNEGHNFFVLTSLKRKKETKICLCNENRSEFHTVCITEKDTFQKSDSRPSTKLCITI